MIGAIAGPSSCHFMPLGKEAPSLGLWFSEKRNPGNGHTAASQGLFPPPPWGSGHGLPLYQSGASSEPMVVTVRPDQEGTAQAGVWGQYQLLEPRLQSEPRGGWGVKAQHWSWLCGHRRSSPLWAPSHENSTIPKAPLTSPIPDSQGQDQGH